MRYRFSTKAKASVHIGGMDASRKQEEEGQDVHLTDHKIPHNMVEEIMTLRRERKGKT